MARSLPRWLVTMASLFLALAPASVRAQAQSFDSIGGAWWFRLAGKDAGAIYAVFGATTGGSFPIENIPVDDRPSFGFSRELGAFFTIDAGQELAFDSKGNVTGTLALTGTAPSSPGDVGELTIEKGKPNKDFTRLKLRATLLGDGGEPLRVRLDGRRVPVNFPVLTGRAPDGKLGGNKVSSSVFVLDILTSADLGLPGYTFQGDGPAEIDGIEVPDVTLDGTVILSPDKQVFGLLEDSSDFGTGTLSGKLHLPDESVIPKLKLTARADRKVTAKGNLSEAIEPVLSVTPVSFDFGGVRLDATTAPTQVFQVSNVGVGTLSGTATFQSGSSTDFSFVGDTTYGPLAPGDPAEQITVQFDPTVAGAKSAEILFSVTGGAGSRLVSVTGTGGVPVLTAEPAAGLPFGNVVVGQSRTLFFTLTNTGDGPLSGNATITTGTTDFALVLTDDATNTVLSIPYTLQPAQQQLIRVRFTPTSAAQKTGTLNLTGGAGAQRALSGTGTTN